MSFSQRIRNNQNTKAATALTGDIGTQVAGNTLLMQKVQPGSTIVAETVTTIATASLTATLQWQGSIDNSTFINLVPMNNAALVTITATATKGVTMSAAPLPFKYVRLIATTGGTTATASDTVAIKYHYIEADF